MNAELQQPEVLSTEPRAPTKTLVIASRAEDIPLDEFMALYLLRLIHGQKETSFLFPDRHGDPNLPAFSQLLDARGYERIYAFNSPPVRYQRFIGQTAQLFELGNMVRDHMHLGKVVAVVCSYTRSLVRAEGSETEVIAITQTAPNKSYPLCLLVMQALHQTLSGNWFHAPSVAVMPIKFHPKVSTTAELRLREVLVMLEMLPAYASRDSMRIEDVLSNLSPNFEAWDQFFDINVTW